MICDLKRCTRKGFWIMVTIIKTWHLNRLDIFRYKPLITLIFGIHFSKLRFDIPYFIRRSWVTKLTEWVQQEYRYYFSLSSYGKLNVSDGFRPKLNFAQRYWGMHLCELLTHLWRPEGATVTMFCMLIRVYDVTYLKLHLNHLKLHNFTGLWKMVKNTIKLYRRLFLHKTNKKCKEIQGKMFCTFGCDVSYAEFKTCNLITSCKLIKRLQNLLQGYCSIKLTNICHKNGVDVLDTGPTTTLTEISWQNDVFLFYIRPKWKKDIKKNIW